MHRLVRIGIVAAVAACVGTAALAVAESNRYPSAKQIPTVVTGPITVGGPAVAADAGEVLQPAEGPPAVPITPSPDQNAAAVVPQTGSTASAQGSPPEAASAAVPDSGQVSDGDADDEREVVTRAVRDEGDEHASSAKESDEEESKEPSRDSQSKSSEESKKK